MTSTVERRPAFPGASTLGSAAKKGSPAAAAKIVSTFAGLLLHFTVSRELGLEVYAAFAYMVTIAALTGELFTCGWSRGITRFCSESEVGNDAEERAGIASLAHVNTLMGAAGVSGLVLLTVVFGLFGPDIVTAVLSGLLLGFFLSLNILRRRLLVMEGHYLLALLPVETVIPFAVVASIVAGVANDVASLFTVMIVTHAGVLAVMTIVLLAKTGLTLRWPAAPLVRHRFLWPLLAILIGVIGQLSMNRLDILMVGAVRTLSDTGLYAAAGKIAKMSPFFLGIITMLIAPKLSRHAAAGHHAAFRRTFLVATVLSVLLALPIVGMCLIAPVFVLGLLGDEFTAASSVLIVLALGQFVNAVTGPCAAALLALSLERTFAASYFVITLLATPLFYLTAANGELIHVAWMSTSLIVLVNLYQLVKIVRVFGNLK